jgi:ATP phosphoribosyltransferase
MRLRIAIQKSGRLAQNSLDLLKRCGLSVNESKRQLLYKVKNFPVDILNVRDDDIPGFVDEGICDVGIIGRNSYEEERLSERGLANVAVLKTLGFSRCRLSIALPENKNFRSASDLQGMTIATSYCALLKDYLQKNNVKADIVKMQGSVEVAPHLMIADAICDLVSTGATLEANGLVEADTVLRSEAILINNNDLNLQKRVVADQLVKRIDGVLSASESKYIMLNTEKKFIKDIVKLLPGAASPTIIPLKDSESCAIHAVCLENVFWQTMENLEKAGAKNILVMPIEKMMI